MKQTIPAVLLTIAIALGAAAEEPLLGRYIARGFNTPEAMLSAYLALPAEQRDTASFDRMKTDDGDCHWYPFMLVYQQQYEREVDSPYLSTMTVRRVTAYLPVLTSDRFSFVKQIADPEVSAIVILWTGSRDCRPAEPASGL